MMATEPSSFEISDNKDDGNMNARWMVRFSYSYLFSSRLGAVRPAVLAFCWVGISGNSCLDSSNSFPGSSNQLIFYSLNIVFPLSNYNKNYYNFLYFSLHFTQVEKTFTLSSRNSTDGNGHHLSLRGPLHHASLPFSLLITLTVNSNA